MDKQFDEALKSFYEADAYFVRAIRPIPNNRPWRTELIEIQVEMSACLADANMHTEALAKMLEAIRNSGQLLANDPNDYDARRGIIRQFIRYGKLCIVLNDKPSAHRAFFTAGRDCNLLRHEPYREWRIEVRHWAIVQAMKYADDKTRPELIETELTIQKNQATSEKFDQAPYVEQLRNVTADTELAEPTELWGN